MRLRSVLSAFVLIISIASTAQIDSLAVRVVHGSTCSVQVTLGQMQDLTHRTATVKSHDGAQATYEGVWLKELLNAHCGSIAALDKRVMVRSAVKVTAADAYSALVALTEADSSFRANPVILA